MPKPSINLAEEVSLDPSIQFTEPLTEWVSNPAHVFLTGVTGFLGAYLLAELLNRTDAVVHCLVRAENDVAAFERVKKHLEFYAVWDEQYQARVVALAGDLGKPNFALTDAQFDQLAEQVDLIYHNGAVVNIVRPYKSSKPANVLGTQEVLRLASLKQTKPVHYVSTMGIFFAQKGVSQVLEADIPPHEIQKNGYTQSKWVAEQTVRLAAERGLPITIYRPTRIMGHSQTGIIGNFDDFLYMIFNGCLQMGKYPLSEATINFVPMDYASQAIIHLSLQTESFGQTFHIANTQPNSWRSLFEMITQLGYDLQPISYEDWLAEIDRIATEKPKDDVFGMLQFLGKVPNSIFAPKPLFDDRNTQAGISGVDVAQPAVDTKLLATYFNYFKTSGFID